MKEFGQKSGETSMEFLRRLVNNMDHETESLLDDLPSIDAIIEYFNLWNIYDTDFLVGIEEAIEVDGNDPGPYNKFKRKFGLTEWPSFERSAKAEGEGE